MGEAEHDRNVDSALAIESKVFDDLYSLYPLDSNSLTIRDDPNFRVQTALLWTRHADITSPSDQCSHNQENERQTHQSTSLNSVEKSCDFKRADDINLEHLHLHRDRLAAAIEQIGWHQITWLDRTEASLRLIRRHIDEHLNLLSPLPANYFEPRKLRILIRCDGDISVDSIAIGVSSRRLAEEPLQCLYIPASLDDLPESANHPCQVCLDEQPSEPSILTNHKTSYRHAYDSARNRVGFSPKTPPTSYEVLLYNRKNEIFDGSISTVYFKRRGVWITPHATCGPVLGTTRRLALQRGLCEEGVAELNHLIDNESIWLSNAVRGFFKGVLVLQNFNIS